LTSNDTDDYRAYGTASSGTDWVGLGELLEEP
jgi:hypothetical protein